MTQIEHNSNNHENPQSGRILSFHSPGLNLHVQLSSSAPTDLEQGSDKGGRVIAGTPNRELDTQVLSDGTFRVQFYPEQGLFIDWREQKNNDLASKTVQPKYHSKDTFTVEKMIPVKPELVVPVSSFLTNMLGTYGVAGCMEIITGYAVDYNSSGFYAGAATVGMVRSYLDYRKIRNRVPIPEHLSPGTQSKKQISASDRTRGEQMDQALFIEDKFVAYDEKSGSIPDFFGIDGYTIPTFELLDYLYGGSHSFPVDVQGDFVDERIRREQFEHSISIAEPQPYKDYLPPVPGEHYKIAHIKASPAAVIAWVIGDLAPFEQTDDVVERLLKPMLEIQGLQAQQRDFENEIATIRALGIDERLSTATLLQQQQISILEKNKRECETGILYTTLDVVAAYLAQREEALAERVEHALVNKNKFLEDSLSPRSIIIRAAIEDRRKRLRELLACEPITDFYREEIEDGISSINLLVKKAQV